MRKVVRRYRVGVRYIVNHFASRSECSLCGKCVGSVQPVSDTGSGGTNVARQVGSGRAGRRNSPSPDRNPFLRLDEL